MDRLSLVAGLGCRHGIAARAVIDVLQEAIAQSGRRPTLLAIPDFKRDEPGLHEAAAALGLPVLRIGHAALRAQQPRCVTRSERVRQAVGVGSVAEACALAGFGEAGRLLLPRIVGAGVTCALAVADKEP